MALPRGNGEQPALVEVDRQVMTITMNRPLVRNAVNEAMSRGVARALDELAARTDIRVAVLTGSGRSLQLRGRPDLRPEGRGTEARNSGHARPPARPAGQAIDRGGRGLRARRGLRGRSGRDLVVAAENAVFGLPEARRGLVAGGGGGLIRLPRFLPERIAMELAAQVVDGAPTSVAVSKSVILGQRGLSENEAFALQDRLTDGLSTSADAQEGAAAFVEKRPPGGRAQRPITVPAQRPLRDGRPERR